MCLKSFCKGRMRDGWWLKGAVETREEVFKGHLVACLYADRLDPLEKGVNWGHGGERESCWHDVLEWARKDVT